MKYMGGKRRIAKHILPIMLDAAKERGVTTWVEPFVGGGNMIDKVPSNFRRLGFDINPHVIASMIDIRDNVDILPDSVSEDEYRELKGTPPGTISSWIRFVSSFGGIFEGSYARQGNNLRYRSSPTEEGKRNAQRQSPLIQGVQFVPACYKKLSFKNSIIYCDPPYRGVSGYKTGEFDHDALFQWCREQAKNNIVFLSEYDSPFEIVWEGEIKTNFSSSRKQATHNAVERLYRVT